MENTTFHDLSRNTTLMNEFEIENGLSLLFSIVANASTVMPMIVKSIGNYQCNITTTPST